MNKKNDEMQLEILYEDSDIIAVNKPAGMLSIPARGHLACEKSLLDLLKEKYGRVYVVHRLDREASGVILFAKNPLSHRHLSVLFETGKIVKKYIVLSNGVIKNNKGVIEKPIKQFGSGRMGISSNGKESRTKFKVIKRYKNHTLLEVSLLTGRRHQIRVHLYSIGHPVAGDKIYGNTGQNIEFPRLMLHSRSVEFKDISGKKINVKAELPEEFKIVMSYEL